MWPLRIIKFLFQLWLRSRSPQGTLIRLAGSRLIDRMLKNYQSNAEVHSNIREADTRDSSQKPNWVTADTIPSAKPGNRVGLFLLGVLVAISLLILIPVLWLN